MLGLPGYLFNVSHWMCACHLSSVSALLQRLVQAVLSPLLLDQ